MSKEIRVMCITNKMNPRYIKGKSYTGEFTLYGCNIKDEYDSVINFGFDIFDNYFNTKEQLRCNKIKELIG